jgi:hypothetical protein
MWVKLQKQDADTLCLLLQCVAIFCFSRVEPEKNKQLDQLDFKNIGISFD